MGQVHSMCVFRDKETGRGCDCNIGPGEDPTPRLIRRPPTPNGEEHLVPPLRPPRQHPEASASASALACELWLQNSEASASASDPACELWRQQSEACAALRAREQLQQENERLRREVERLNKALEGSTETTWQVFDVVERHYRDLEHHNQAKLRREHNHRLQEDLTIGYEAEDDYDLGGDSASQASAPSAASAASGSPGYCRCDRCCCRWQLPEPPGGVCPRCQAAVQVVEDGPDMSEMLGPASRLPRPAVHLIHSVASLERRLSVMRAPSSEEPTCLEAPTWKPAAGTPGSSSSFTASTAQSTQGAPPSGTDTPQEWRSS